MLEDFVPRVKDTINVNKPAYSFPYYEIQYFSSFFFLNFQQYFRTCERCRNLKYVSLIQNCSILENVNNINRIKQIFFNFQQKCLLKIILLLIVLVH